MRNYTQTYRSQISIGKSMEQPKNDHSELDVQKYYGKNTNYVIEELQKQGQSSDGSLFK